MVEILDHVSDLFQDLDHVYGWGHLGHLVVRDIHIHILPHISDNDPLSVHVYHCQQAKHLT